jgi:ADP-heptose:LPS heptosyltransferase
VTFALVGAADEREEQQTLIERLAAALPGRFVDLVGKTDVRALAALIERAELLVGNDSGPMQIAVALRVPTVVPWGPSDYPRNAPRDPLHTILFKGLPCSPCYHMPGDSQVELCTIDRACLKQITIDEVAAAAESKLVQIVSRR